MQAAASLPARRVAVTFDDLPVVTQSPDDSVRARITRDLLASGFTNAWLERRHIDPRILGVTKIGHFGFFRPEHRDTLWRDSADWLGESAS